MKRKKLGAGIHSGIPAAEYHADPCKGISLSSNVANILLKQSPLHAWYAHPRLNKKHKSESNGRFDIGTAAHSVCLEGDMKRVEKLSFDSFRTNDAKAARDAAYDAGKIPLMADQYDKLSAMREAFHFALKDSSELDAMFTAKGKAEQTIVWQEKEGKKKFWFRGRTDWLADDRSLIVDYKTVETAEPEAFIRGPLVQHGYDVQAEFYLRGLRAVDLSAMETKYVWILQEIEPPFACSFVGYGEQMAEIAAQKVERAIQIWKRCLTTKQWPSYGNRVAWASLPTYAVTRWEEWQAMQGFINSSEQ